MQNLLPHSFSLHPNHLTFFAAFTALIVALSFISVIQRAIFTSAPYSLLVILNWSLLLAICFNADYYRVTPRHFAYCIFAMGAGGAIFAFSYLKKIAPKSSPLNTIITTNSISELLTTLVLWLLGLSILLVPLAFGFPPSTLVTGHFICNDSVVHSIMAEGISFMQDRGLDPFYYSAAPRGVHSFTYYFHSFFREIPTSRIILPTAIVSYSLITLAADMFLRSINISPTIRFFTVLLTVSAFLPVTAVYTIFLGQVSVAAPLFGAVALLFSKNKFGNSSESLLFFSILTLGAITAYGLFPISLIGFGVGLSGIFLAIQNRNFKILTKKILELLKIFTIPQNLFIATIILFLLYPSIKFVIYVLGAQGTGSVGSDLYSAIGNLPEGYLSPLHLSGIWPPGIGYREQLTRNWSALSNILIFVIFFQFFLVSKAPIQGVGFLLTFAIPCLATAILINSPYVHFKYICYLVPAFLIVAGTGLGRVIYSFSSLPKALKKLLTPLTTVGLITFNAFCVIFPLPTATIIPALLDSHFTTFEDVWKTVEGKRTLVLTREDWFQYGAQSDDFVPLIIYIPQVFNEHPVDAIVIDQAYKTESLEYLSRFPKLLNLVNEKRCMTFLHNRFEVYYPDC